MNTRQSLRTATQLIHACTESSMPPSLKRIESITRITFEKASTESEEHRPENIGFDSKTMSLHVKAVYVAFIWCNWELKRVHEEGCEHEVQLLQNLGCAIASILEYQLGLDIYLHQKFDEVAMEEKAAMV